MAVGIAFWLPHVALGWESFFGLGPPVGLSSAALAAVAYLVVARFEGRSEGDEVA
jgi:hypothetical protein